jgi:hypothetical protein
MKSSTTHQPQKYLSNHDRSDMDLSDVGIHQND